MTMVGVALISLIGNLGKASLAARRQMTCGMLAQSSMNQLKNMDFYYLFAVDSSSSAYGLIKAGSPWTAYPYTAVLNGIQSSLSAAGFDRFKVSIIFMRRDTTDANHNGMTSDLIPFTDDGHGVDAYDPNIKYYDQNGDGDYYDTYVSNGRIVAEQPDTHIKQVTLDVYDQGQIVCSQTSLISLEQFQPGSDPSSESILSLLVSTPTNNAYLYQSLTPQQQASLAISLVKPYPANIVQMEADSNVPLLMVGQTEPIGTVNFYVGGSGILDSVAADSFGDFSFPAVSLTSNLVEGSNQITAQTVKGTLTSPLAIENVLLDVSPPVISGETPQGAAGTCAPYVAATLSDPGVSTTTTSGICPSVITMEVNGSTVNFSYDAASGNVVWIDTVTGSAPDLNSGTYSVYLEAGDYAGYKATSTWTFTPSVNDPDNSAPSIAQPSPIGGSAGSDDPTISAKIFDNQSGIVPSSIQMSVDGVVVVSSGIGNIGSAYDPSAGTVSYAPPAAYGSGSMHTVSLTVSHCAQNPPADVSNNDTWNFTVP